jgi:hypothetical protein
MYDARERTGGRRTRKETPYKAVFYRSMKMTIMKLNFSKNTKIMIPPFLIGA